MLIEFYCAKCTATNIFKSFNKLSEKKCRVCDTGLNVQRDLVRYERDRDGDIEIILHERVERLIEAVSDIANRMDRLEKEIFGDADDEDLSTVN